MKATKGKEKTEQDPKGPLRNDSSPEGEAKGIAPTDLEGSTQSRARPTETDKCRVIASRVETRNQTNE